MDSHRVSFTPSRRGLRRSTLGVMLMGVALVPLWTRPHQLTAPAPLVFDGVTVVNVENGQLLQGQRVVIVGNRISAMGSVNAVPMPRGARVVDARTKYLIPGLWDMHVHLNRLNSLYYPMLIANGVTGIRNAGSNIPLDTLLLWRREILAGTRVGPPRQLLSGQSIAYKPEMPPCDRSAPQWKDSPETCVADSADARHYVDSLKAAGADMIKPRAVTREMYFVIAAEARRVGIPFGGHAEAESPSECSDSGAVITDHRAANVIGHKDGDQTNYNWGSCFGKKASVELCQPVAEQFRRNGTWFVPTMIFELSSSHSHLYVWKRFSERARAFWAESLLQGNWLGDSANPGTPRAAPNGFMNIVRDVGLPILAGTDSPLIMSELEMKDLHRRMFTGQPQRMIGFSLHTELATYVAMGLTPLGALQTATLNPAKLLQHIHAPNADALGTVAPGKLADLVLLDANPLEDITNTTAIRAVVANGRYYDRAALDSLLLKIQARFKAMPN